MTATAMPDYSKLKLVGDHHARDSFSLTLQAAARLLGKDVDYETVYALSTNAFAPDIRPDEQCRCFWRMRGRGQCLDLVAARLGLVVRPLGGFAPRRYGDRSVPWPERMRRAAAAIRPALEKGQVVITDSGWRPDVFCWWGIVLEAREDGTILGATQNGRKDNPLDHACSFWALSPAEPTLAGHEADLKVLSRVVARIRGDREPFLPDSLACELPAIGAPAVPGAVIWGLPAMDRWIEQMEKPAFQQDDPGSSAGNARLCAVPTFEGARAASGYLAEKAMVFSDEAYPHLVSASKHYGEIASLLRPAVLNEGGRGYTTFMGDPEKQKAHADVLRQVRAEFEAAAGDLEKILALQETRPPGERVILAEAGRTARRTICETLEAIDGHRSSMLAVLAMVRACGQDDVDYGTLMTVSGCGPIFTYGRGKNYWTNYVEAAGWDKRVARSTGINIEWRKFSDAEEAWKLIKSELDQGRPVAGKHLEDLIFAGYQDADEKVGRRILAICCPFAWPCKWWTWEEFIGWVKKHSNRGIRVYGRPADKLQPGEAATEVLAMIVEVATDDPRSHWNWMAESAYGLDAIRQYAEDIGNLDLKADDFQSGWRGCHNIYPQWTARQFIAKYLHAVADEFPKGAGGHIIAAAAKYDQAHAAWEEWERHLGNKFHAPRHEDVARDAWSSQAHRKAGSEAVLKALAHEKQAVEELKTAIEVAGKPETF